MKTYTVILPIAGHAYVEVEADNAESAKEKAFETVRIQHIENWEALDQFNSGNVCYCPSPWQVEVDEHKSDE